MFEMFSEKFLTVKVSYEKYKELFNIKFNISFGYPRSEICSICDQHKFHVEQSNSAVPSNNDKAIKPKLNSDLMKMNNEKELN